jgi:FixJ family two-component response regulator
MTANSKIVYLLDDDERIRKSVGALLSAARYHVRTFADAMEFMRFPRADKPSCLLLDLNLGDSSGLELQQTLASDSGLAIIFSQVMVTSPQP